MLDPLASQEALLRLFRREPVVDIDTLFGVLDTGSRMSVFRRLKPLGYLSSITHNGRYYTLLDLPRFDAEGIWFHRGVGFSRAGTLKATVVQMVESSEAGRTHQELCEHVRVRVHNPLLLAVRSKQVRRDSVSGQHLYLSAERDRASRQLARRHELVAEAQTRTWELPPTLVIEVLSDVLRTARLKVNAPEITSRLRARSIAITLAEVERVLDTYGIVKKGARRRSRRSKR